MQCAEDYVQFCLKYVLEHCLAGGLLRTSTRPTLNLISLLRASV
jgi:hypothetical protein